ncbi:UDP-N-acetylglucosamine 2-epimerase (non-hydrolyzing) [Kutzneria viridogrisea]|uniref:UDP-N-acetylglucosamine 2-epimerase (non-hydrolyzing) n=2 Tax=Kutzneria TaxID=43356 RepID=W5W8S9_9PSEU|nr:UDP-N-acetylglucosamine 2-epimerase (non-hydrolyzing) [Kutzneria albida]AHH96956.1 UDP-N-acetylglucosamine 2-epimerase [Kutzneria albida DSM 43870]MBA8932079.1 UDP-N-acetylglucosamine 2-epimerase (non-hydrolyzing) [Kutzneria viridogrisea]
MEYPQWGNGSVNGQAHSGTLLPDTTGPEVHLVGGSRAEAIKLAPVVDWMHRRARMRPVLVDSGQHDSMFEQALGSFALRPDLRLRNDQGCTGQASHAEQLSGMVRLLDEHLMLRRPAAVVAQGDTTTALATALAAFWRGIPVVHLEAGLRSHNVRAPFPEETTRRLVAQVSTLHLAPTSRAAENLRSEGLGGSGVLTVGSTAVDAAIRVSGRPVAFTDPRLEAVEWRARCGNCRLLVVTVHRQESWGAPLAGVLNALTTLLQRHPDLEVVLPIHPHPALRKQVMTGLFGTDRVHVTAPLPYDAFCRLLSTARLVLTDSGGVQEEAPIFGVPVLVLRENTERVEAVEAGCSVLVGTEHRRLADHVSRLLQDSADRQAMVYAGNPFGDGHAGHRVEHAIAWMLGLEQTPPCPPQSVRYTPSERLRTE